MERPKPSSRLVESLCDKVCCLYLLTRLAGMVVLTIRHTPRLKPAIEYFWYSREYIAGLRMGELDLVDVWFVEVDELGAISPDKLCGVWKVFERFVVEVS